MYSKLPVKINISIFEIEIRMSDIFLTKKSVLLILPAQDFNEQEYLVISNALERAQIKIFIASDANTLCVGSNGMKVKNDVQFYNIHESNFGGIVFIGGKGVKNYWNNPNLHSIAQKFQKNRKTVGAICSAAVILAKAGLLIGNATCYPEDRKEIEKEGIEFKDEAVVKNNKIITGRDPMAAAEFSKVFLYELAKNS